MKSTGTSQPNQLDAENMKRPTGSGAEGRSDVRKRLTQWGIVFILAFAYLTTLTPGHVFMSDDFAAYIMHAANLVEGRPYTAINYVPNPKALWLAPTNGYPPVYPLLLAPIYKVWGRNLRALKVATVLCFVAFLVIFAEIYGPAFSSLMGLVVLLILGFNSVFWEYRDNLLSEFPYLMFSFGALLVIQSVYKDLDRHQWRIGMALLLSALVYCTYGTRTIGIVLLPALGLADLFKFKRPSRFMGTVLAFTAVLIIAQTIFLTAPRGYLAAVHFSSGMVMKNVVFYAKTLSYVWQNGTNKGVQIAFALLFTALAATGFARKLCTEGSALEFYLLSYLAVLFGWSAEIGLRGLLPILPLYVAYGLQEFSRIVEPMGRLSRSGLMTILLLFVAGMYAGEIRTESHQPPKPNVQDPAAQELFSFLQTHTQPTDVLIFPKPRSLALFTNCRVASLAPDESDEDSYQFVKSVNARFLIEARWSPPSWQSFLEVEKGQAQEVFHNSDYRVFQLKLDETSPVSSDHSEKLGADLKG